MDKSPLSFVQELMLPTPLDVVWDFLLNEEEMKGWLKASKFIIDAYEGGEIEIPITIDGEDYLILGDIGLVQPKKRFVFTWREEDARGEIWFNNTTINFGLQADQAGTKIRFAHEGFNYLPAEIQQTALIRYTNYWESGTLEQLGKLLSEKQGV